MRAHIKLFTLQIDIERARQLNATRAAVIGSLDQSTILSMGLRVDAPEEPISGR